jgi:FlaA1/EpsC-like NDP-sugar epimerase
MSAHSTEFYNNKTILVTGAAGSVGSEIAARALGLNPRIVRALDDNETGLFDLEKRLQSDKLRLLIGDVRDKERLRMAIEGVDLVFHAAALKHVPLCEYNPFEAVKTNVLGTQNVIEVAMDKEVEKLITISTDKAVNPVNVMGATKLLAERLTTSANYYKGVRKTAFSCVRFGNVLDSRGSVVPLFKEQIRRGGPVMITDPNMTRFVMSIPRAVDLVLRATEIARGGEIFIFKMPALRIGDLAEAMIEELAPRYGYDPKGIKVEMSGKRVGEKIYEELLTEDEAMHAAETEDMFVITPAAEKQESPKIPPTEYKSDRDAVLLTKKEIKEMLGKACLSPTETTL